jgi:hypothetical protein
MHGPSNTKLKINCRKHTFISRYFSASWAGSIQCTSFQSHTLTSFSILLFSKKGSKRKTSVPQDKREDQVVDGRMWFRGMHYNCWGQEGGGEELRTETNGGVLWGRPRPRRGCSTVDGWTILFALLLYFISAIKTRAMDRLGHVARVDEKKTYSANGSMTYFFRNAYSLFCLLNLIRVFHLYLSTFAPSSRHTNCRETLH